MLKKMVVNIGGVSFVFALIMALAALSTILLGRILSPNDLGEFAHVRYLVLLIPPLAIWGQGIAITRFFSKNSVELFRWDLALYKILSISTLLSLIGVVIAHFIYDMAIYKSVVLFIGSFFYCATLLCSHLMRSQGRYKQAIFMFSGFRGLFFVFLIVIFLFGSLTKYAAIYSYIGVIVLVGLASWIYTFKNFSAGRNLVPNEMHSTGLLLMGIDSSVIIMASLDGLFIKGLLGNEMLALYVAALGPGQIFKILNRSAKYVWVPEFGRNKSVKFKKINIGVAAVSLLIFAVVCIGAHPILDFIYDGKYNDGVPLLRIFAMVGVVRMFYSLNSSYIIGKMAKKAVRYHFYFSLASVFIYCFLLYYFLTSFGVIGAAWALLAIMVIRLATSYYIVLYVRKKKPEIPAV